LGGALSIIVPAFNEEGNIGPTLDEITTACDTLRDNYEIIVVNDCSVDRTAEIVLARAKRNARIRLVSNERNLGFGGAFMRGVNEARMDYCIMVCADNAIPADSLRLIFSKTGEADLVLSYIGNPKVRELSRRIISRTFVLLVNLLTGFRVRYYNGFCVYPTQRLKSMTVSKGFAYAAQIIVKLLNEGYTYVEVPMITRMREHGTTSAFKLRNLISVFGSLVSIALHGRRRYWTKPTRVPIAKDSAQPKKVA
jgi:glycosyltransferase involved in cell wall biosynthesis